MWRGRGRGREGQRGSCGIEMVEDRSPTSLQFVRVRREAAAKERSDGGWQLRARGLRSHSQLLMAHASPVHAAKHQHAAASAGGELRAQDAMQLQRAAFHMGQQRRWQPLHWWLVSCINRKSVSMRACGRGGGVASHVAAQVNSWRQWRRLRRLSHLKPPRVRFHFQAHRSLVAQRLQRFLCHNPFPLLLMSSLVLDVLQPPQELLTENVRYAPAATLAPLLSLPYSLSPTLSPL
jgi:hypothetical protein